MLAQCVPSLTEMDQEILSKSSWYLSEGSNQGLPEYETDEMLVYSNDLKTCLNTLPIQLQISICNHYAFPSTAAHTILSSLSDSPLFFFNARDTGVTLLRRNLWLFILAVDFLSSAFSLIIWWYPSVCFCSHT